jgi:hypothetical protein
MENKQNNQLNMFRTVIAACDNYHPAIITVPAFLKGLNVFKAKVFAITNAAQQHLALVTGAHEDKQVVKKNMVRLAASFASAIRTYAAYSNNNTLKAEMNFSEKELLESREDQLFLRIRGILNKANLHLPSLSTYGIDETLISILHMDVTDLNAGTASIAARPSREGLSENLKKLFLDANTALDNLDENINRFEYTFPDFFRLYKRVRVVNDPARKKTSGFGFVQGTIKDAAGHPVEGALSELHETDLFDSSDTNGNFLFEQVVPGNYQLEIRKPGFRNFSLEIKVSKGQEVIKNVVLEV